MDLNKGGGAGMVAGWRRWRWLKLVVRAWSAPPSYTPPFAFISIWLKLFDSKLTQLFYLPQFSSLFAMVQWGYSAY